MRRARPSASCWRGSARAGYDLREYLDLDAFADALGAADLVVARSGGSVFEIAAHGLPAILVPYPHASADHQSANARWMAQAGAALTIPDAELNAGRLRAEVDALLSDRDRLAAMARAAAELARPQAAQDVAAELPGGRRMSTPWRGRRMHFVGVGGAGMSGYARAAHALGAEVSGSDRAPSPYSERLAADGIMRAHIGHRAENLPRGEGVELVYSSAVAADNAERRAARELGIAERPRAELLAELTGMKRTIAVAGTHGKTTTASMLAHVLRGERPAAGVAGGGGDRRRAGERGVGGGRVAGGRGRRVRSLDAEPERGDGGADERRARPPRDVLLARAGAGGVRRVPGAGPHRDRGVGSSGAARARAGGGAGAGDRRSTCATRCSRPRA